MATGKNIQSQKKALPLHKQIATSKKKPVMQPPSINRKKK